MAVLIPDVTEKLLAWRNGRQEALEELLPLVYEELRRLARYHLRRGRPEDTLQSTALVHEAYLRLVNQDHVEWRDRAHFFGVASHLMRCILVDHYRTKQAIKRGGNVQNVPLDKVSPASAGREEDLVALDESLNPESGVKIVISDLNRLQSVNPAQDGIGQIL